MQDLVIVAGGGQTGRELARRLIRQWQVVLIDPDPVPLDLVRSDPALEGVRAVLGDATSSLVLREAGMTQAAAAVAAADRDEVNLEFCRLARQLYNLPKVVCTVRRRSQHQSFEDLGVTVISRPHSLASALQSHLEQSRRTTSDVGLGQGEILEVTVESHSPVAGKTLAQLSPQSWLVGAIYRNGRLVVPHGHTEIVVGDRVLLVGEPNILPSIADYFRAGDAEFPLQFGSRIVLLDRAAGAHSPTREEARWLAQNSHALGLRVCNSDGQEESVEVVEAPAEEVNHGPWASRADAGCLVLPPPVPRWSDWLGFGQREYFQILESIPAPVLVARSSSPYGRVLVTISSDPTSLRAVEIAIDLARVLGLPEVTAAVVYPPELVTGPELKSELARKLEKAVALGKLFRFPVIPMELQGNPVHQVLALARQFDLLVIAHRRQRGFQVSRPDVSRHLILRAPISTLVWCHGGLRDL